MSSRLFCFPFFRTAKAVHLVFRVFRHRKGPSRFFPFSPSFDGVRKGGKRCAAPLGVGEGRRRGLSLFFFFFFFWYKGFFCFPNVFLFFSQWSTPFDQTRVVLTRFFFSLLKKLLFFPFGPFSPGLRSFPFGLVLPRLVGASFCSLFFFFFPCIQQRCHLEIVASPLLFFLFRPPRLRCGQVWPFSFFSRRQQTNKKSRSPLPLSRLSG